VAPTEKQIQDFGQLLRDRRDAAGLSRVALGRLARMSDATIKLTESARQPPSRATLLRLIGVPALRLTWDDVPGHKAAPPCAPVPIAEDTVDRANPPEEAFWDHKPGCLCDVTTPSQVHALALVENAICHLNAIRAQAYARRKTGESGR
jgi:transcriptional regulator with XRE-family HTH domain